MTFRQSLTTSVGVSKLDYTGSILVDPGVKIKEICYYDLRLSQQLLPAGEFSKQCASVEVTLVVCH